MSEIRNKITNILNNNKNTTFKNEDADEADKKILEQLNRIDGLNVDFKFPCFKDIVLSPLKCLPINCFTYALNLHTSKKYRYKVAECFNKYRWNKGFSILPYTAYSTFVNYLLLNYLQELPNPTKDCLVIYFDSNEYPKHAAIVESEIEDDIIVRSKWGTFNALITHKLWHVPCKTENCTEHDYGTSIKYYDFLSQEQAEEYFLKHIQRSQS